MSENETDERLAQLVAIKHTFEGAAGKISGPKIQRVPDFLRQNPNFAKYCSSPEIISFGPIHHHNENLKLGQHYKNLWASRYIEEYGVKINKSSSREASKFLHDTIRDNIVELKKLFSEDVIEGHDDKELIWMLFVDGCSMLYYMDYVDNQRPEALELKLDQLMYTWRDILLLENQLPLRLLQLLSKTQGADLEFLLTNYMFMGTTKRAGGATIAIPEDKPKQTHILHCIRSAYVDTTINNGAKYNEKMNLPPPGDFRFWKRYKTIQDLKTAGIRIKPNKTNPIDWHNISFTPGWFGGELRLPVKLFNDNSPYLICNMIAYEMCPDFVNNFGCCSYVSFMDSLIDNAEDVKELRLAGVFQNMLGSDEELATFFNKIGNDLPTKLFIVYKSDAVAFSEKYVRVKLQIESHYSKRWNRWLADARITYFNTPWSFMAFLAALLALVLTFVQTMYTIYPKKN